MRESKFIKTDIYEYLNEQNTINTILDKINKFGIENLTDFEKNILSTTKEYNNINDDIIKWLDSNYSNLHTFEEERKSFGILKHYIVFMDDDMEMVFEYDENDKKLYIPYNDIRENLGDHFNEKTFIKWFKDKYNIDVIKIGNYFKNI